MREGEREEDRRGEWPIPAESGGGEGGKGQKRDVAFCSASSSDDTIRLKSEDRGGGGMAFNASMCNKGGRRKEDFSCVWKRVREILFRRVLTNFESSSLKNPRHCFFLI